MKFFEKSSEVSTKWYMSPQLLAGGLAVFIAVLMWYMVSVRDRLEAQVEVNIDYYGIPANLVVTEGLITKISVRLRGPETLLRSIPRHRLTQAVDLSHIKKGTTIVPLGSDKLGPTLRAFELVDVQPPRIVLKADTLIERVVPVRPIVDSPLRGGALTVENISVSPATVLLRGPEGIIADMSNVPMTIMLDPKAAGTTVRQTIALDTPSLVTTDPAAVRVQYTITSGRTVVSRRCRVEVTGEDDKDYVVEPAEVTVLVEVPEALARSAGYLNRLSISVIPPLKLSPGQGEKTALHFSLPEGMTLLKPTIDTVLVRHKDKGASGQVSVPEVSPLAPSKVLPSGAQPAARGKTVRPAARRTRNLTKPGKRPARQSGTQRAGRPLS